MLLFMQFLVYRAELPFFEKYKIQKEKPWPWQARPKEWHQVLRSAIALNLINICGTNLLGWFIYQACVGWTVQWETDLDKYPGNWVTFKQTLFCLFMEDTLFHFAHRLFHSKSKWLPLYKIHKKHHEHLQPLGVSA